MNTDGRNAFFQKPWAPTAPRPGLGAWIPSSLPRRPRFTERTPAPDRGRLLLSLPNAARNNMERARNCQAEPQDAEGCQAAVRGRVLLTDHKMSSLPQRAPCGAAPKRLEGGSGAGAGSSQNGLRARLTLRFDICDDFVVDLFFFFPSHCGPIWEKTGSL